MEKNKKVCLVCKKEIEDKQKDFCNECYELAEKVKKSGLFKYLEEENLLGSFVELALISGLDNKNDKGENK